MRQVKILIRLRGWQADLNLHRAHISEDTFADVGVHIICFDFMILVFF